MPITLRSRARHRRALATVIAVGLLLAGSMWGSDDDFPFGPFRMYAGRNDPNGIIYSTVLDATLPSGRVVPVAEADAGFRRADLEGQLPQIEHHPDLLADIATAHHRLHPAEPPYVALQVHQLIYHLHEARIVSTTDSVLARWARS